MAIKKAIFYIKSNNPPPSGVRKWGIDQKS